MGGRTHSRLWGWGKSPMAENNCEDCGFKSCVFAGVDQPAEVCADFLPKGPSDNAGINRILASLARIEAELARQAKIRFWGGPGNVPLGGGR